MNSGGAIAVPGGLGDPGRREYRQRTGRLQVERCCRRRRGQHRRTGRRGNRHRTEGDIYTQVAVDTYGVAGAPEGAALSRFTAANRVSIGNAALTAQRDILIAAGQNTSGQDNLVAATARTDLFNNTLIPISTKTRKPMR